MADDPLDDFDADDITHLGATRRVYRIGAGPAVIVMAEMPGITPGVADFARKVAAIGATAVVPSMFGVDGRDPHPASRGTLGAVTSMLGTVARACVSREFTILAAGRSSPIVDWLRELARAEHQRCGGPGVGAVGMCFTGGFALAMAADDVILAPVLSQPSMPFRPIPRTAGCIDIADDDLATVRTRCASGLRVMGLRFQGDPMVPARRFTFLREQLGDAFIAVELPDSAANPDSMLPTPHSVLTEDLIDAPGEPTREALDQVLVFLADRLAIS